jgi:hypothetical protein
VLPQNNTTGAQGRPPADPSIALGIYDKHSITIFDDLNAHKAERFRGSWTKVIEILANEPPHALKEQCRLFNMAVFNGSKTANGSLRANDNITVIAGLTGDHDAGTMSIEEAIERLEAAGIVAVVFPSARHTPAFPRWRVVAPLHRPVSLAEYAALMNRLNGVLRGVLSSESWTASQAFFFGPITGKPYKVHSTFDDPTEGSCIDQLDELDQIALGKQLGKEGAALTSMPVGVEAIAKTRAEVGRLLREGDGRREAVKSMASAMSARGVDADSIRAAVAVSASAHFDPRDPVDWRNVEAVIRHFVRKDSAARSAQQQAAMDALRQARRQEQKDANADIQRLSIDPLPTVMSQDDMLRSLVFVQDGSQVCALDNPRLALPLSDARNTFAASVTASADGKKMRPAINGWLADPSRLTVARRTFMPGEDVFCMGPEGHPSINTWRDFKRAPVANSALAVGVFLEQVTYLIADETERAVFLNWLAHIEQQPGVLPHFGWLMIARHTGTGRNWLASVLARVWRGHVAPNVDLTSLLESQFNGQLSEAMLAMVDEIQEGGEAGYRHINRLKSLLNAEVRAINPKYGRTVLEKNVCRWLVFSNHENAIPMADTDRRWRVVVHNEPPRAPADYERLYQALADPAFIAAIAHWLRVRDISGFKPGERPPMSAAKSVAVDASKSGVRRAADQLIEDWGSDLITAGEALRYLEEQCGKLVGNAARHALVDAGARSFRAPDGRERKVSGGSKKYRVWSLRNHDKWSDASASAAKDEVQRGSKDSFY